MGISAPSFWPVSGTQNSFFIRYLRVENNVFRYLTTLMLGQRLPFQGGLFFEITVF